MKPGIKKKLMTAALLIGATVALVEFQKFMQSRVPPCEDGICRLPADKAGAIVGPQGVPDEVFMKPPTNPPAVEGPF